MKRIVLSMLIAFMMNNAIAQIRIVRPLAAGIARESYHAVRNIQNKEYLRPYHLEQYHSSINVQPYKDSKTVSYPEKTLNQKQRFKMDKKKI